MVLAYLAYEIDSTQFKKVCREIITLSDHNPYQDILNYFSLLSMSVKCGELEMAEQLLKLIEKFPETQFQ